MTTLLDKQVILAPPAVPPRYGLFVAATQIPEDGTRWQGGVQWAPEQAGGGGVTTSTCVGSTASGDLGAGDNIPVAKADPFVVWAEDHCSTIGWQARDYVARATRQLEATQSYRAANELWIGTVTQSDSLDNVWLTEDPEILVSAALDPIPALALLEIGLSQMLFGRRGMIHVSPQVMIDLHANYGLEKSGDLWVTPIGNIVVSDAGYPGTKPDAATSTKQWIYATPLISYRLGEVIVLPGNLDQARAQALVRDTNLIQVYAEREVMLQWDSTVPVGNNSKKPVLAVETTVPTFAFAA